MPKTNAPITVTIVAAHPVDITRIAPTGITPTSDPHASWRFDHSWFDEPRWFPSQQDAVDWLVAEGYSDALMTGHWRMRRRAYRLPGIAPWVDLPIGEDDKFVRTYRWKVPAPVNTQMTPAMVRRLRAVAAQ